MLRTLRRVAFVAAPAIAALAAACTDSTSENSSPTAPLPPDVVSIGSAAALRGTVITRARHLEGGPSLGVLRGADTSTYVIAPAALGATASFLETADGEMESVDVFAPSSVARRSGKWSVHFGKLGTEVRLTATGGAPPTETEYVRNGEVVARAATVWLPIEGGWRMASRTITLLENGVPTESIEREFGAPTAIAVTSQLREKFDRALAPQRERQRVDKLGASKDEEGGPNPCESQIQAAFSAMDDYKLALAWFGGGCLSGNAYACFTGSMAVATAWTKYLRADDNLGRCVAAM